MTAQSKSIDAVRIVRQVDDNPDLSYLGAYSQRHAETAIDRVARGDSDGHREYRYFHPTRTGETMADGRTSEEWDYDRYEAYNRGDWQMCGVYAEARIIVNGTVQTIRSPGLWGIESDSGDDYFAEVAGEELEQLRETLAELGFSARMIRSAVKHVDKTPVDA